MPYILLIIAILLLVYGPSLWVKYVLRKHNRHLDKMPGTGSELARHLIERFGLEGVVVEKTAKDEDYYSPGDKKVGLSPEVYDGKSITAIAVAAHEVGHAIQYANGEPISRLREKYTQMAGMAQNIGITILTLSPLFGVVTRSSAAMILVIMAGVVAMLSSVAIYAMILPEEYDASFSKALPILDSGYLPEEYMPAARQVLKACALTYVAAALADILSVWRWLSVLR
jgi:Zn-dependent membrane protease YugP